MRDLQQPGRSPVHATGAMWGVLSPVRTFEVTEKVEELR